MVIIVRNFHILSAWFQVSLLSAGFVLLAQVDIPALEFLDFWLFVIA